MSSIQGPARRRVIFLSVLALLLAGAYSNSQLEPGQAPVFSGSFYADVPTAQRAKTFGATDPTWSPDGRSIAFSLYGGIWRMAAEGGTAEQLTATQEYDAGPAWSPDGAHIAFVRGQGPIRGVQLGTQGKLMLLNAQSLETRVVAPELNIVGSPAWSRDGKTLFANHWAAPDNHLHAIDVAGGRPRRLTGSLSSRVTRIVQRGAGWYHFWYPAAARPDGEWLAYAGDRDNTPQLWLLPLREGLVVTRKLTRFQETDQADIQDLTWDSPRSILYSANLHSDRTNFDLWRWSEEKGAVRLTATLQDEFSPRLSPDARTVVFVSNYLGNLDLFTTTPAFNRARHLPIEGLKFRQPKGRLRIRIRDERSQPVRARASLRAADGKYHNPPATMWRHHPGMGKSAGFFFSPAEFELELPVGPAHVSAFRGLENSPANIDVDIKAGATTKAELLIRRVRRWQGNGWWTGENHIHANYAGPYYLRPEEVLDMVAAEDLNVANMLAANAEGSRVYDREFFTGAPNRLSNEGHILYWNEEFRNRIVYGHMALLNLKQLTDPVYTSFEGTPSPYDYPSNTLMARRAREAGGVVDYVHPIVGNTWDPFEFTVSAKELPVTAALGLVDVVDIYPWGPVATDIWYALLNCGFRIAPGAGTDTFSNWRALNQVPGNSRVYVRSADKLSYGAWISGLRAGRSFVTNGPLLRLEVSGKEPGETVRWNAAAATLPSKITVESPTPIESVEIVVNGRVVATETGGGRAAVTFEHSVPVTSSGWLAARVRAAPEPRAFGAPLQAHTAPVYLEAEGKPAIPDAKSAAMMLDWVDRLWNLIEMRNNFEKPAHKEEVRKLVMRAREFYLKWRR